MPDHPGGQGIILKYAGKDATEAFDPVHPPDIIDKYLPKEKNLGDVDTSTIKKVEKKASPEEQARLERIKHMPPLGTCLNLTDFEIVAEQVMKPEAWAYYSSAADDEVTMNENHEAYRRIFFRPRILINVEKIDTSTNILGFKSAMPFYITATALGKLGHPEGEKNLTRAAGKRGLIQMIPTLASCSLEEITDARVKDDQIQFMQLYVNKDRERTKAVIEDATRRGAKALFVTVDAPQLGRREKDMRMKYVDDASKVQGSDNVDRSQGAARAISSFIDPSLNWDDIPWLRKVSPVPIILKGVQTAEDALKAVEYGVQGIVCSNHGGRQLDFARSGIEVLAEVMEALKAKGWENKLEVFVDGGIRRATDMIKALAMGAKAVGIGRPFLYAMSAYGEEGVVHAIDLLRDEMEMGMRLIGAPTVKDIVPNMVDFRSLNTHNATSFPHAPTTSVLKPKM